jgi:hypothetical protein
MSPQKPGSRDLCQAQIAGFRQGMRVRTAVVRGKSMKKYQVWGLSAALAAAVGGLALAGDPNMQPNQTTLAQKISDLFDSKPSKPTAQAASTAPATITAPLAPEVLAKCLQAEQDAYLRRVSVCTELRRVAEEKGDHPLIRQADELEKQAETLYNARVSALGIPKSKSPAPESSPVLRLEEPASPKVAADKLLAPAAPIAETSTAEIREVKP